MVATGDETRVAIFAKTRQAVATVQDAGRRADLLGNAAIDGVPGTHAPIPTEFRDTAGSSCGALLPSATWSTW